MISNNTCFVQPGKSYGSAIAIGEQTDFNLTQNFTVNQTMQGLTFCGNSDGSLRGLQMQTGVNNTALIPQNTFGNIDADISDFKPCSSWVIDPNLSIKTITVYYNATQVVSLYIGLNDTSVKKFGSNSYAMF